MKWCLGERQHEPFENLQVPGGCTTGCPACCGMDFGPWPQLVEALKAGGVPAASVPAVFAVMEPVVVAAVKAGWWA